jgi:hypothetical protein
VPEEVGNAEPGAKLSVDERVEHREDREKSEIVRRERVKAPDEPRVVPERERNQECTSRVQEPRRPPQGDDAASADQTEKQGLSERDENAVHFHKRPCRLSQRSCSDGRGRLDYECLPPAARLRTVTAAFPKHCGDRAHARGRPAHRLKVPTRP